MALGVVGRLAATAAGGAFGWAVLGTGGAIAVAVGTLYLFRDRSSEDPGSFSLEAFYKQQKERERDEQRRRACGQATINKYFRPR